MLRAALAHPLLPGSPHPPGGAGQVQPSAARASRPVRPERTTA